ncbi:MAG: hypothetical protein GF355_08680 [Candidatus Eisenbacteria bacterium]|nr:hypothetical protein [Candidatus Eisenbacteria bacterium]
MAAGTTRSAGAWWFLFLEAIWRGAQSFDRGVSREEVQSCLGTKRSNEFRHRVLFTLNEISLRPNHGWEAAMDSSRKSRNGLLTGLLTSYWFVLLTSAAMAGNNPVPQVGTEFGFNIEDVHITNSGEYDVITYDGGDVDRNPAHVGEPQLPVVARWYLLPAEAALDELNFTVTDWDTLSGSYIPIPIQPPGAEEFQPPEPDVYEGENAYPRTPYVVTLDGYMRGYHLVKITVYPLHYLPATEELVLHKSVRVSASLRRLTAEEESHRLIRRRPEARDSREGSAVRWIRGMVENPGQFEVFYPRGQQEQHNAQVQNPYGGFNPNPTPSVQGSSVRYVIITNNTNLAGESVGNMIDVFEDWADWRTQQEFGAVVVPVDDIEGWGYEGVDRAERIRNFLRHAYADWGTDYVLLGGDVDVVPARFLGGPDSDPGGGDYPWNRPDPPADYYYALLDENWNDDGNGYFGESTSDFGNTGGLPEIWIGRIPARNATEAEVIMTKIGGYERRPGNEYGDPSSSFYTSVLGASGPTNSGEWDYWNGIYFTETYILPEIPQNWTKARLYTTVPQIIKECPDDDYECFDGLRSAMSSLTYASWTGDALRDSINSGYHFVWHLEHSARFFWGNPSGFNATPTTPDFSDCDTDWQGACKSALEDYYRGTVNNLTREQVLTLTNGSQDAGFSIALNAGSFNNMHDRDAISEAFLRAPNGGAVASIGKTSSYGGYGGDAIVGFLGRLFDSQDPVPWIGPALILGIMDEVGTDFGEQRAAWTFPLLGDPAMPVWTTAPTKMNTTFDPTTITELGPQTIKVTVKIQNTITPVEDAVVCLMQGDRAYGVAHTDGSGVAEFKGFPVVTQDPEILVTVTAPNYVPLQDTLEIGDVAPEIVYHAHELTDFGNESDGDGDIEAGERLYLRVVSENVGDSAAASADVELWPSPMVRLDLKINGTYDPDRVYIGKEGAHPPAATDSFRLPTTWEGFRTEGEPNISTTEERFKVWRSPATGMYTVEAYSASASRDSTFEGILRTRGSFSNVSMDGEAADDYFWSGDSIWFEFSGDRTPDCLHFRAHDPDWIAWVDSTAHLGQMDPGDTLSGGFELLLSETIPDGEPLVYTMSVVDDEGRRSHSDFGFNVKAPALELVVLEKEFGDFYGGCDTSLALVPSLLNRGSAEADSAVVVLHKTGGTPTVLDSVVSFSTVAAGTLLAATDSFAVCATDTSALRAFTYSIDIETFVNPISSYMAAEVQGGGGPPCPVDPPTNLKLHAGGQSMTLVWDPVDGADRYAVLWKKPNSDPVFVDWAVEATRFEVTPYTLWIDYDPDEDFVFQVRACDGANCSEAVDSDTSTVWLEERSGWPKVIPHATISDLGGATSLKVVDLDDDGEQEIFAAGSKIFAWHQDGTPLVYGAEDGLLYDPQVADSSKQFFTEALAIAANDPSDQYDDYYIVGNVRGDGMHVLYLRPDGEHTGYWLADLQYEKPIASPIAAPVIANLGGNEDVLALLVTAPSPTPGHADTVYAWQLDTGGAWASTENPPSGELIPVADGSRYNYRDLAIGRDPSDPSGQLDIIQTTRLGNVYRIPGDRGAFNFPEDVKDLAGEVGLDAMILSTPTVGDVDGDGEEEVVVTNQATYGDTARVFVLSVGDLAIETQAKCTTCAFKSESGDVPSWGPALADIDSDDDLEIIVTGRVDGGGSEPDWAYDHEVYVFDVDHDGESYELDRYVCRHTMPLPGRKAESVRGSGTPTIAKTEGGIHSDAYQIVAGNSMGGLMQWTWHPLTSTCESCVGWPIIFSEVPLEPVIADLDDSDYKLNLLVQTGAGEIHVFDYPGYLYSPEVEWGMYGYDLGNTRRYTSGRGGVGADGSGTELEGSHASGPSLNRPVPSPFKPSQQIAFYVPREERVKLSVYDVQGREVHVLADDVFPAGMYTQCWTGRDGNGARVASGVYFYRIRIGDYEATQRTIVVR